MNMHHKMSLDERQLTSCTASQNLNSGLDQSTSAESMNDQKICVFTNQNLDIYLNIYKFTEFIVNDLWRNYSLKQKLLNHRANKYREYSNLYTNQNDRKLQLTTKIIYKIQQVTKCSQVNFILSIIYLDRIIKKK